MATQHEAMFSDSALQVLLEHHGESVTYTPYQGAAVAVTAVVGAERVETIYEGDRRIKRRRREVTISTDSTSSYGGVASPALKATVTIGTTEYSVLDITPLADGFSKLTIARPELMDRDRQYRGRR